MRYSLLALALLALSALPATVTPSPVQAQSAAPTFELEGNALKLPKPVLFKTASDELTAEGKDALGHVKAYLDAKSYITLMRVEGHVAPDAPNGQVLSEKRAMAAAKYLVSQGIDCKRLLAVGFGDTKPVASNADPAGKAQNTRLTFVNAMLRDRAIGGMPVDGGGNLAGDVCAK